MTAPFLRLELRRRPGPSLLVCVAVAVSVGIVTAATSLMWGVYVNGVKPLVPSLPLDMFQVEGRTVDVGILSLGSLGNALDQQGVDRIAGLPGVAQVHPVRSAGVPMRAAGGQEILGRRISTDVFAQGVDAALVADALPAGEAFVHAPGEPIPVVLSTRLLELYNTTVAPVLGQPRLSPEAVRGLGFELWLGLSATRGRITDDPVKVEAKVVGLSDRASLAGITVPAETVARWDAQFQTNSPITRAWVRVAEPGEAGRVAESVERAGFRVDEGPKLIGWALVLAGALGGLLSAFLIGLGALATGLAFSLMVTERRMEIAVLRALGAERSRVLGWFSGQALFLGLLGSALGCLAGWGLAAAANLALDRALAGLAVGAEGWISFPPWLWGLGLALGPVTAWLGALPAAVRASRLDPAQALRS